MAEIAIRRRGPEGLPDSSFLVFFFLAVHALLVAVVAVILTGGLSAEILIRSVSRIALFFAFVYAVLCVFRLERRYRQTVGAMLGANIVIQLAFLPVGIGAVLIGVDILGEPFTAVSFTFELWSIFIGASILARSVSQPLIVGIMLEILLVLTSLYAGQMLAPAAEPVAVEAV